MRSTPPACKGGGKTSPSAATKCNEAKSGRRQLLRGDYMGSGRGIEREAGGWAFPLFGQHASDYKTSRIGRKCQNNQRVQVGTKWAHVGETYVDFSLRMAGGFTTLQSRMPTPTESVVEAPSATGNPAGAKICSECRRGRRNNGRGSGRGESIDERHYWGAVRKMAYRFGDSEQEGQCDDGSRPNWENR